MTKLSERFAEVEERVKALIAENADLKKRAAELELELAEAQRGLREMEDFQGKKSDIRKKIESVLRTLETARDKK